MPPLENFIADENIDRLSHQENLFFDEKRTELLKAMHSLDVQACPGSGKTTLIAAKLILLAEEWPFKHRGVCVLSHTNVAKDEIIERLKKSKTKKAQNLLSYPHFIGTIQEFVNRFLAIPNLRSRGICDFNIDNDTYTDSAWRLLGSWEYSWLKGTLKGLGTEENQKSFIRSGHLIHGDDGYEVCITKRAKAWNRDENLARAKDDLMKLKRSLCGKGYFLFRDMYVFGDMAISDMKELEGAMQKRFPFVLIDEMQDTQKFQDDLLTKIFPLSSADVTVQRFGDADQAIFHGINNEEGNESYNGKPLEQLIVINQSHRFDSSISSIIKGFSFNEIPLSTELNQEAIESRREVHTSGGEFEHTVFVYEAGEEGQVIQAFAEHVSRQFTDKSKISEQFSVKVVGAVGNEINQDNQLKIGHYWEHFKKDKSKSSFKETTLFEAVTHCCKSTDVDWSGRHKILNGCLLRILGIAGKKDTEGNYYNVTSMKEYLKENGKWEKLRELSFHLVKSGNKIKEAKIWGGVTKRILESFDIGDTSEELENYLQFRCDESEEPANEEAGQGSSIKPFLGNTLIHDDGFKIELSTIHGVKGETHDATLVLETKHYCFDMQVMMPYLTGKLPTQSTSNASLKENPNSKKANQKFMRQFYVAMSRPKHLLCLAIHSDHISEEQKELLSEIGWKIQQLR